MTWSTRLWREPKAIGLAVLFYGLLALLGSVSLVWNFCAALLYPVLPSQTGRTLGRAAISTAYRACWTIASAIGVMRINASCLDALSDEPRLIVIANHPTMLDALLLVARLPRSACIMKAELMKNIFLGAGARLARYIRNDSPRTMVRLAIEDLRAGGQLVLFPEGTRTVTPPVNAFRPGVTLIAKRAQAPIQTVFIETDSPFLRKGWPMWRLPPLPMVITLRLGQRFAPMQDSDALLQTLEDYFRQSAPPLDPPHATGATAACQTPRSPTLS